jgi:hypothetical protein
LLRLTAEIAEINLGAVKINIGLTSQATFSAAASLSRGMRCGDDECSEIEDDSPIERRYKCLKGERKQA